MQVDLGPRSYEIAIVSDELRSVAQDLERWLERLTYRPHRIGSALVVTDHNVRGPHGERVCEALRHAGWRCELISLEPGEQSKSLRAIAPIYDALVAMKADRHTVVVATGGGVVGDAAGFVAATYTRGVPYLQVPTSLLAQVDSSVGGKVAVNHSQAKNLIGAFYQPVGVFIDTDTLNTLPDREYRSGLGEVVKYGVIQDAEFFAYLEAHSDDLNDREPGVLRYIVARCCRLKADVVEQDEFERTGLRSILNYGHTFAHAFEALSHYDQLLHGEAVAIGMIYASRLAERMKLIEPDVTQRQLDLLKRLHLPTRLPDPRQFTPEAVLDRMKLDKKAVSGRLRFVLPTRLGHVELFKDVSEHDVRAVLEEMAGS
ncbi:MAG: 3-dehydroquinate synthase [Planctomycetes bacterium]|nr:3-dehydroquinate synthase [Planctomycetota bacterium]